MWTLARWQLRQVNYLNWVMVVCVIGWSLFTSEPISFMHGATMASAIFVHAALIVLILGSSSTSGAGFIYSQGFSRDQIWWSQALALLMSAAMPCVAFLLTVGTGLRGIIQGAFENPWFPLLGSSELSELKWMLLAYAAVFSTLSYIWIRARQPSKDAAAGWMLAVAQTAFFIYCWTWMRFAPPWLCSVLVGTTLLLIATTTLALWKFHQSVEVQA
ncbi:MAG: hypothetical protein H6824_22620 [Planctomycetaceae bacterium]|nr:hypothetical protein [Planctomycetaceae bacterium]